jgi:hypothetical protein
MNTSTPENADYFQSWKPSHPLIAGSFLLAVTVCMFGPVLFSSGQVVISQSDTDLFKQFAYWRLFGFNELRQGNLPLWNPHVFSGVPFLGGFQSALFYPLNALFLVLPLSKAINGTIALHVFLLGLLMFLWTSYRGLHPVAGLVSAAIVMFCSPHFLQIYAGHLPHLCTMTWAPLVFLSIDGFLDKRSIRWLLLGVFAVAMQILGGYPQHVFYTGVAASVYLGLLLFKTHRKLSAASGFFAIYAGACLLAAIQLLPGLQVAAESVRSQGASYEFASRFSFPPENLLTLLNPNFFGNDGTTAYWGRFYYWEMSFFVGITGLVLAICGFLRGRPATRRFSTIMALVLLVLALGRYTPVFHLLYSYIPGFASFRGSSKFLFQASLFVAMLSGIGLDHIIQGNRIGRHAAYIVLAAGLVVGVGAILLGYVANGILPEQWWRQLLYRIHDTGESYLPEIHYKDAAFLYQAGMTAAKSLAAAAATLLLLAFLFFASRKHHKLTYMIGLLAVIELFVAARASLPTFHLNSMDSPVVKKTLAEHSGDYRVLNLVNTNVSMATGTGDIWGYDSVVLKRYAEFMTFTQGFAPEQATQYVAFHRFHRLFKMLRCRFAFVPAKGKVGIVHENDIMPRLVLIQNYQVIQDRDAIFEKMESDAFDPRNQVILERQPSITPVFSDEKGTISIADTSTDHLSINAFLPSPAILLITDVYSAGWQARPLAGSSQKVYEVMPANYILQAIPLSKGNHKLRLEYAPMSFQIGKWISIMSLIVYAGLTGWSVVNGRRSSPPFRRKDEKPEQAVFNR